MTWKKSILEEIKVLDVPELNMSSHVLGRRMDSGCSDDEVFSGRNYMKFIDTVINQFKLLYSLLIHYKYSITWLDHIHSHHLLQLIPDFIPLPTS